MNVFSIKLRTLGFGTRSILCQEDFCEQRAIIQNALPHKSCQPLGILQQTFPYFWEIDVSFVNPMLIIISEGNIFPNKIG